MKADEPEDWQKAIQFDREVRAKDKFQAIYLHEQRVPLDQVELHPERPRLPLLGETPGTFIEDLYQLIIDAKLPVFILPKSIQSNEGKSSEKPHESPSDYE